MKLDDNITVKFEIWDTAGCERYHSLVPMYYRGAQAAIVVYDITEMVSLPHPPHCNPVSPLLVSQNSFVKAKEWVKELKNQASPNIVIALAGNKVDLNDSRKVNYEVCIMYGKRI